MRRRLAAGILGSCIALMLGCQGSKLTSGKLYLKQGEPAKAREQLLLALETEPDHPEAHFLLGRMYGDEGDYAAMAESFRRSLHSSDRFSVEINSLTGTHWARVYNQGVHHAAAETPDFAAATEFFAQATVIDSDRLDAWRNLAFSQYQLRRFRDAIGSYERVAASAPEDTSTYNSLGILYLNEGEHEAAMRTFQHLLARTPTHLGALTNVAAIHFDRGAFAEAEEAYARALEVAPNTWQTHYNLGNLLWKQERYGEARQAYGRALELNPGDVDSRYNLAITHLAMEQLDAALPLLEELSQQTPGNAAVWSELGRIYALKERVAESKAAYARASALGTP